MAPTVRPERAEYPEYYHRYVELVPGGPIVATLRDQILETLRLLEPLPEARAMHRYAPGKWSVKEVVGHMADAERVFAYRALRFARADATPLTPFEENDYVANGNFDARALPDLLAELRAVREATVRLFDPLDDAAAARKGSTPAGSVSARALAWIIAGHERHHRGILAERYLA
ncbi:MAG: DinB family protein [Hyphomicrobiales bacterium]